MVYWLKCGCTDTNDAECSGRPNLAVVPENTKKLHKLILADHKLKLHEIAEELKMSGCSVFTILHKHLSMRKLCSKWVLCLLTVDQKQHVDNTECCLQLFQHNKKEFLCKYMTIDETWIHHFTPESNQQSAEWTAAGKNCPKWPKMQTPAGKVLASIFWNAQGILFINYLKKQRTINSKYYIALLVHLKEKITKRGPQMKKKSALRQYTVLQVDCNNGRTTWIALQIVSAPSLFSRSGPQKNAAGKEIWLQWRNDIGNWGIVWGLRQIIELLDALESVYHPRRLLMNKVKFCLKVVVLWVKPGT